jgi:ABC-2 type transport system permease protein
MPTHSLASFVGKVNSPTGFFWILALLAVALILLGLFTNTMHIAWRELKRHFRVPESYLILAMFLLYQGLVFFVLITVLNRPDAPHSPPMRWFFGGVIWFYPIYVFVVALLTADLLTDEQRFRTIETLMTSPVRESEVVLGKFLGALGFYSFMWLWTLSYVWILSAVSKGQSFQAGPILSGYLGALLVGSLGLAFGILCSSISRNLRFAMSLTGIGLLMVFIVKIILIWDIFKSSAGDKGEFLGIISAAWLNRLFEHTLIIDFMDDFSKGIVDMRHVVFLVSGTVFCLFAATRVVQLRKWR